MSAIKLTKREKSWIVYDVGNSAFVLLASTLIPIYFSAIADSGSSVVVAWGYATTVASLLLALLMPFLGSIADLKGPFAVSVHQIPLPRFLSQERSLDAYVLVPHSMRHYTRLPFTASAWSSCCSP